jgi:hypothetical protein
MAAPLPTAKQQLLKDACSALHKTTHSVRARAIQPTSADNDGMVELTFANGRRATFTTTVHTNLNASVLVGKTEPRKTEANLDKRWLHVTSWVSPDVASALIARRIPFMDTAGNAFIENDGNTVLVVGNPRPLGAVKRYASKAVTPKGISVAYTLLTQADAIALPLRQLATLSGAALSTANEVVADLQQHGVVGVDAKGKRFFLDKQRAMREWMSNYSARVRPRLDTVRFQTKSAGGWWRTTDFQALGAFLGGEPAAEVLVGILKARYITIYCSRSNLGPLVKAGKLALAPEGDIEIVEPFWPSGQGQVQANSVQTVHPLLVCADLTRTGDSRNLEAAQEIYDQFLANS